MLPGVHLCQGLDARTEAKVPREGRSFAKKKSCGPSALRLSDWNVGVRRWGQQPPCHHESVNLRERALGGYEASVFTCGRISRGNAPVPATQKGSVTQRAPPCPGPRALEKGAFSQRIFRMLDPVAGPLGSPRGLCPTVMLSAHLRNGCRFPMKVCVGEPVSITGPVVGAQHCSEKQCFGLRASTCELTETSCSGPLKSGFQALGPASSGTAAARDLLTHEGHTVPPPLGPVPHRPALAGGLQCVCRSVAGRVHTEAFKTGRRCLEDRGAAVPCSQTCERTQVPGGPRPASGALRDVSPRVLSLAQAWAAVGGCP